MNLVEEQVIKHLQVEEEKEQEKEAISTRSYLKNLELMELSLGNINNHNNNNNASTSESKNTTTSSSNKTTVTIEKEHMFDKVVTPSDVGKLNRLVIPKQHAERYFPLDSSSNEKGLLLNFEDRNGKPWRFRYSYWNSSQSYVMTKGWSRFVKEKKLDAGDTVSFQRGVGDQDRHRLFIDWRRRASNVNVSVTQPNLQYSDFWPVPGHRDFHLQPGFRWGNQLICSLPHFQAYGSYHPAPYSYVRPSGGGGGGVDDVAVPMVIDSVPVVEGRTVGKRLRLFGVNMDCPVMPSSGNSSSSCGEELEESHSVGLPTTHGLVSAHHLEATSTELNIGDGSTTLQLRLPMSSSSSSSSNACGSGGSAVLSLATTRSHELSKKNNSLSFDLDL